MDKNKITHFKWIQNEFLWYETRNQKFKKQIKIQTIYKTTLSYCLKCRKNTDSKNPKVGTTKNRRTLLLAKCALCNRKKPKFTKEQEAKGLLGNLLGAKMPILGDIPLINTLF